MTNDRQLQRDVEQELAWEPSINAEQIGVSVKDGVVELDGHVGSYYEKQAAERAALRIANVKAIASEIRVELPFSAVRTNEDIARAAKNQLEWNISIPTSVKVKVDDGWVTLQGNVDWQYQKQEAERCVRPLLGVRGVTNKITLQPKVLAGDVKNKIEEALKRNAQVDADHIAVTTSDGVVTLSGRVKTWAERRAAENATFAAPGVTKVNNRIQIGD